jgi:hypothetical protein
MVKKNETKEAENPKINNVGIRVGFILWWIPIAKLIIHKDYLEFNGSALGNFFFLPKDVLSIELKGRQKGFFKTFKINHSVPNYPTNIYIICSGKCTLMDKVLQFVSKDEIAADKSTLERIKIYQESGPSPFKKQFLYFLGTFFGVLLAFDGYRFLTIEDLRFSIGVGTYLVLGITALFSLFLLVFPGFSRILLKNNRTIKDVNRFLYLLLIFSTSTLLMNLIIGSFFK